LLEGITTSNMQTYQFARAEAQKKCGHLLKLCGYSQNKCEN